MSGDPDPLYVRARAALLDAAEAIPNKLEAVVLVGAQAVYIHTGDADFGAVAAYTTDADSCVAPAELQMPSRYERSGLPATCRRKDRRSRGGERALQERARRLRVRLAR